MSMCGTGKKRCAICGHGEGGCLAGLREDYYVPATKTQIERRLSKDLYKNDTEIMKAYLKIAKDENNTFYDKGCCEANR